MLCLAGRSVGLGLDWKKGDWAVRAFAILLFFVVMILVPFPHPNAPYSAPVPSQSACSCPTSRLALLSIPNCSETWVILILYARRQRWEQLAHPSLPSSSEPLQKLLPLCPHRREYFRTEHRAWQGSAPPQQGWLGVGGHRECWTSVCLVLSVREAAAGLPARCRNSATPCAGGL